MTPAERLRDISAQLRTYVAEGDFASCDAHVEADMGALPDALETLARELSA